MSDRIVCKPTPWFLLRAAAMLLMFGIFSVLFFVDGKWGYREKNYSYFISKAFETAHNEFRTRGANMSPEEWKAWAESQTVKLPEDLGTLPEGTPVPLPWPAVLQDHAQMTAAVSQSPENFFKQQRPEEVKKDPPEQPYDARKIAEQWWVFGACAILTVATVFVLLRTLGRRMSVDETGFQPVTGGNIPFSDLVRLDLRKWDTKGLAFVWSKSGGAEKKHRIDGLTYGGFKKEDGEPAEQLMRHLKENFSGEIIEYVTEAPEPADSAATGS